MTLPHAENAVVDTRKLRDYCLNPEHDEGKHKAALFAAALGMNRSTVSNHLKALERSGMAYHNGANTSAIRWSVVRSNIRELYPQGR